MVNHHNDNRLWGTVQRKPPLRPGRFRRSERALQRLKDFLVLHVVATATDPEIRAARRRIKDFLREHEDRGSGRRQESRCGTSRRTTRGGYGSPKTAGTRNKPGRRSQLRTADGAYETDGGICEVGLSILRLFRAGTSNLLLGSSGWRRGLLRARSRACSRPLSTRSGRCDRRLGGGVGAVS